MLSPTRSAIRSLSASNPADAGVSGYQCAVHCCTLYRAAHACKAKVLLTGDLRDFGFLMNAPELADGLLIQTVADFLGARRDL